MKSSILGIRVLCVLLGVLQFHDCEPRKHHRSYNRLRRIQRFLMAAERDDRFCQTPTCWKDAHHYGSALDLAIDPCDDFYEFACGSWLRKAKIPASEGLWDAFTSTQHRVNEQIIHTLSEPIYSGEPAPIKAAKTFFSECTNVAKLNALGTHPLHRFLTKHGGWPLIERRWFEGSFCLPNYMTNIYKMFGINSFLQIAIYPDLKNLSHRMITLDQPPTIFPKFMLRNPHRYDHEIKTYGKWIMKIAMELVSHHGNQIAINEMRQQALDIVDFEIALTQLLLINEDRDDFDAIYNIQTISQLQVITDQHFGRYRFEWLEIFQEIFGETDVEITLDRQVIVYDMDYLVNMVILINRTPARTLANYLGWHLVHFMNKETTGTLREFSYDVDRIVFGIKKGYSREEECKQILERFIPQTLGYIYLKQAFNNDIKYQVLNMTELIRDTITHSIERTQWMDESTQLEAVEKAAKMKLEIGFMGDVDQRSHLEATYADLKMTNNHFKNVILLSRFHYRQIFARLDSEMLENEVPIGPTVVNAFNHRNTIYVLAAILQFPFYGWDRISALNFGGIGTIIGHEIIHSFDNKGRQFDKNGNLVPWWTNDTLDIYNVKMDCFIDQYNNYEIQEFKDTSGAKHTVNGLSTVGENIADAGGLRQAFHAYKRYIRKNGPDQRLPGIMKEFTPDQLFFISFANKNCEKMTQQTLQTTSGTDGHPPNRYRTIGTLSNSREFAAAFSCPIGTPMNPIDKCQLW